IVTALGTPFSTGATFTSLTVIVMLFVSVSVPSLTITSNVYEPGPWASVGVHVNAPLLELMLAPDGSPLRLKVSVCADKSWSVAVAVKPYGCSSSIVTADGTPESTGATLTSETVIAIVFVSVSVPSLTITSNVYVPGPWASVGVQVNA